MFLGNEYGVLLTTTLKDGSITMFQMMGFTEGAARAAEGVFNSRGTTARAFGTGRPMREVATNTQDEYQLLVTKISDSGAHMHSLSNYT